MPHQAPQPRFPLPEREVRIIDGCKNQMGLRLRETRGLLESGQFLLNGPYTELLRLTPSELWHRSTSSKYTRDIDERTELSGIGVRAGVGGAAFSLTEVLAEAIVLLMNSPPTEPEDSRPAPYLRLHQPGSHCLTMVIPKALLHPTFRPTRAVSSGFSI